MKLRFLAGLLTAAFAMNAQQTAPTPVVLLVPFGTWQMCADNPALAGSWMCSGQATAPKLYQLLVTATDPAVSAFSYSITFTRSDGTAGMAVGLFQRNDDPAHMLIASHAMLDLGAVVTSASVSIAELRVSNAYTEVAVQIH